MPIHPQPQKKKKKKKRKKKALYLPNNSMENFNLKFKNRGKKIHVTLFFNNRWAGFFGGDLTGYQYQHKNGVPGSLSNTR